MDKRGLVRIGDRTGRARLGGGRDRRTPAKAKSNAGCNCHSFVDSDIFRWGSPVPQFLIGSLPLVILYAFFVKHCVSAMTGALKE